MSWIGTQGPALGYNMRVYEGHVKKVPKESDTITASRQYDLSIVGSAADSLSYAYAQCTHDDALPYYITTFYIHFWSWGYRQAFWRYRRFNVDGVVDIIVVIFSHTLHSASSWWPCISITNCGAMYVGTFTVLYIK